MIRDRRDESPMYAAEREEGRCARDVMTEMERAHVADEREYLTKDDL